MPMAVLSSPVQSDLTGTSSAHERTSWRSSQASFGAQQLNAHDIFAHAGILEDLSAVEELLLSRTASRSAVISAAGEHIIRAGGKRLRAALVLMAGKLANYSLDLVIHPAASAELIHAASLIHDDLVDKASQRRGQVTVHERWSDQAALMVGDFFFALAAGEMALSPDPRIISFYSDAVQTLVEGELSPVTVVTPFEQSYKQYIYKTGSKTAALFEAACKAGITATGGSAEDIEALGRYGYDLGIAFQIMDDVLDFIGSEKTLGKPAGNDIRQGTITLPLIYAVQQGGSQRISQTVFEPNPSDADVEATLAEVIALGGIEYAISEAESYIQRALAALDRFPDTSTRQALHMIAHFMLARNS
jgi:Geranylgeranyl pyrophosphate synthase